MNTHTFNTTTLARQFIGFDTIFNRLLTEGQLATTDTYPPYNIRKISDTSYNIEIAVSGFAKDEIEVTLEDRVLTVTGTKKNKPKPEEFIYKGIAERDFTRKFTLSEDIEIGFADIFDGILMIALKRNLPEEKKPKKIPLGRDWGTKPEFLKD